MANTITIKVGLDTGDIRQGAQQIERQVKGAVDGAVRQAETGGRKIGNALTDGVRGAEKASRDAGANLGAGLVAGIRSSLGGVAGAVSAIATTFASAGLAAGALGAGLFQLSRSAAAAISNLDDLNQKTGLSVETLSALKFQLDQDGVSIQSFERAISTLQKQVVAAQTGNDNLRKTFQSLGIELSGSTEDILGRVIDRFRELPDEAQKTAFATKLFGEAGSQLIVTLDSLNGGLDEHVAKMKELGLVVTPEAAQAAAEYEDALNLLLKQLESIKVEIGLALIPVFSGYIDRLNQTILTTKALIRENGLLVGSFQGLGRSNASQILDGVVGLGRFFGFFEPEDVLSPDAIRRQRESDAFRARGGNLGAGVLPSVRALPDDFARTISNAASRRRSTRGTAAAAATSDPIDLPDLFSQQQLDRLGDQVNRFFRDKLSPVLPTILAGGPEGPTFTPDPLSPDQLRQLEERNRLLDEAGAFRVRDLELAREEARIQNLINAGVLSESEGRQALLGVQSQYRDALIASLEAQRALTQDPEQLAGLSLRIEQLRSLGLELNSTQRFLRGLGSETETLGDIWERFGQNVSRAFGNIRDLFNGLKSAVKQFFADILGNSLRNLLRGTLGALFGGGGAGGGSQSGGGGLIGGVIQQTLGGVFGGSLFGTSGTTSTAGGGGGLNFFGGGSSPITGGLNSFLTGGFAGGGGAADLLRVGANTAGGGFGAPAGGLLNRLFGNLLGVNPSGGFLASATPILAGIGLGAGIGGQSLLGQILGGIGGGAVGLGLSFGASVFGAGGGLGAAALAALGPAALIGAPLLIGAFLLGRAKQRRKDEEQSGVWLTDAIAGIQQIKSGVQTGSIPPDQARSLFENQVLATFIQQINTLKTKSVRESRLTNQVRDLRNLFDKEVGPAIDAAKKAGVVNRNIIPEFHTGGIAADETLALLKKREMVLTESQQGKINAMLPGVFQAVGVPDAPNTSGVYHSGGRVGPGGFAAENMTVNVTVVMGTQDQTQAFMTGLGSDTGKRALARTIRAGRRDGEI